MVELKIENVQREDNQNNKTEIDLEPCRLNFQQFLSTYHDCIKKLIPPADDKKHDRNSKWSSKKYCKCDSLTRIREKKCYKVNWSNKETSLLLSMGWVLATAHGKAMELLTEEDWQTIGKCLPGRTKQDCFFRFMSLNHVGIKNNKWTQEQSQILLNLVKEKEKVDWTEISKNLYISNPRQDRVYRTGKQCREHYNCFLDPNLRKGSWEKHQDRLLLELYRRKGRKWNEFTKYLVGRNQNAIKNRFTVLSKECQIGIKRERDLSVQRDLQPPRDQKPKQPKQETTGKTVREHVVETRSINLSVQNQQEDQIVEFMPIVSFALLPSASENFILLPANHSMQVFHSEVMIPLTEELPQLHQPYC